MKEDDDSLREFTLHDGEDDSKTEELHKFLEGVEWEGDESGVEIILRVSVGDTIIIRGDGSIRVEKKV